MKNAAEIKEFVTKENDIAKSSYKKSNDLDTKIIYQAYHHQCLAILDFIDETTNENG